MGESKPESKLPRSMVIKIDGRLEVSDALSRISRAVDELNRALDDLDEAEIKVRTEAVDRS